MAGRDLTGTQASCAPPPPHEPAPPLPFSTVVWLILSLAAVIFARQVGGKSFEET